MDLCVTVMSGFFNGIIIFVSLQVLVIYFSFTQLNFFFLFLFSLHFCPSQITHSHFHFSLIRSEHILFCMDLTAYIIGDLIFLVTFLITVTYLMT